MVVWLEIIQDLQYLFTINAPVVVVITVAYHALIHGDAQLIHALGRHHNQTAVFARKRIGIVQSPSQQAHFWSGFTGHQNQGNIPVSKLRQCRFSDIKTILSPIEQGAVQVRENHHWLLHTFTIFQLLMTNRGETSTRSISWAEFNASRMSALLGKSFRIQRVSRS